MPQPIPITPEEVNKSKVLVPIRIEFDVDHHKIRESFSGTSMVFSKLVNLLVALGIALYDEFIAINNNINLPLNGLERLTTAHGCPVLLTIQLSSSPSPRWLVASSSSVTPETP